MGKQERGGGVNSLLKQIKCTHCKGSVMDDSLNLYKKPTLQGLGLLILGMLLLLNTFGYVQVGITVIMVLFAVGLIAKGLLMSGIYELIKQQLKR
ncbi:MAG: hypothetical protein UW09_C0001G0286 [candidate division TM6 bacterium GW2011_GWF2_43_87]|nr:MAG: hypothetical protein UW09_C0001G0286 [candidate division TM6 bacterium GW2011_GWF2_43_87]